MLWKLRRWSEKGNGSFSAGGSSKGVAGRAAVYIIHYMNDQDKATRAQNPMNESADPKKVAVGGRDNLRPNGVHNLYDHTKLLWGRIVFGWVELKTNAYALPTSGTSKDSERASHVIRHHYTRKSMSPV